MQAAGGVFLRNDFVAQGVVRLVAADIKVNLDCSDGRFSGRDKNGGALLCDGIQVGGGVFLRDCFVTQGAVRLLGAAIKGVLDCSAGRFEGRDDSGAALPCDGVQVRDDVLLGDGFAARCAVRLVGAEIGGDVSCHGGTFGALPEKPGGGQDEGLEKASTPHDPTEQTLILARATVKGTLWLGHSSAAATFHDGVDLTGASINRIVDAVTERTERRDPNAAPAGAGDSPNFMRLDGLTYARFGEPTDLSAPARIAFLKLQRENDLGRQFKPQPWAQMVKVLREMGHTDAAREVAIEYEEARRKAGTIKSKTARLLHWIYGTSVGYGHRPMRLLKIAGLVWFVCAILYYDAALEGWIAPSNPVYFQDTRYKDCRPDSGGNWVYCDRFAAAEYAAFNPFAYSLDLILPLVNLQQEESWSPIVDKGAANAKLIGHDFNRGIFVRLLMWFEILFGWAASLMFVAIAASFVKRMDSE